MAEALHTAQERLREASIDDAEIEAEVLLRHALRVDRAHFYVRLQGDIDKVDYAAFLRLIERRLAHEPTAYIVGHKEFYGIDFEVSPEALIPRPETELLVDESLRLAPAGPCIVADVGTGCGAIAVALATHLPEATVYAVDNSGHALSLAGRNLRRLRLASRVHLLLGDLLDPFPNPVDLLVANLPYVKTDDWLGLPPEIRDHEPREALHGGSNGMRELERLLRVAPHHLRPHGCLLAEIGWDQADRLTEMARQSFPTKPVTIKKDLAGLDRVLIIET